MWLDGAVKINSNFDDIYTYFGDGTNLTFTGGVSSQWVTTGVGIHTLSNVGIGTTNPTSALTVKGNTSLETLSVSGISTFAGITTVTGSTLFSKQLNVSGVSTFAGASKFNGTIDINVGSATGILFDSGSYTGANTPFKMWIGNQDATARYFTINQSNAGHVVIDNTHTAGMNDQRASSHSFSHPTLGYYARFHPSVGSGGVSLYHPSSAGGILDQKFETTSSGVAIVGVVTAISGIVTYYGDTSNATDGRWTLGANGTSDYTFTGIGFTQTTNDPVLYLARGRVYEFVNNSGGAHPFEIRVSNGGAAYSDGVTNNAAATGVIRFEVPFNAPNTLYYQCTNHSGMGNTISVYPNLLA